MAELLWKPTKAYRENTNIYAFMQMVNKQEGTDFQDYKALYAWSVEEPEKFWDLLFKYLDILCYTPYEKTVDDIHKFPGAKWFPGCTLNYAENMLRHGDSEEACLIFRGEDKIRREWSWKQVRHEVFALATALRQLGLQPGDAVAAYMPNMPETIIAMLATAAVGAVWCSCATDIGPGAAFDRLGQVDPKVLFTTDGYLYKGKTFDTTANAALVASRMERLEKVVVCHYAGDRARIKDIPKRFYGCYCSRAFCLYPAGS